MIYPQYIFWSSKQISRVLFGFIALNSILFGVYNVWVRPSFTGGFCGSISFQYVAVSFSNFALKPCADFIPYQPVFKISRLTLTWASVRRNVEPGGSVVAGNFSVCWGFLCVLSLLCLSLEPPQSGTSEANSYFSYDSQERRWFLCPGLSSVLVLHG